MKTMLRLALVTLIVVLALPLTLVGAQEGDGSDVVPVVSAAFLQTASAGAFADNGDGTYTLTLEGVGPQITWISTSPTLEVYSFSLESTAADWAAASDLTADATLGVDLVNVKMIVGAPAYDVAAGTIAYQVEVAEVVGIEESAKAPELPESFGAAQLSIAWNIPFAAALQAGRVARYEGTRPPDSPECIAATTEFNNLNDQLNALNVQYAAATTQAQRRSIAYQQFLVQEQMKVYWNQMKTYCP